MMDEDYRIEKVNFIEDEIILGILEKLSDGIGKEFSNKAKKLLSKLKNNDLNPIYAKLNIEDISNKLDIIKLIEKAIKSKNLIQIEYKDEKTFINLLENH